MKVRIELLSKENNGQFNYDMYTKETRVSVRALFLLKDIGILGGKNFRVVHVKPTLRTTNDAEWTSESFTMPLTRAIDESGALIGNKAIITFCAHSQESVFADGDLITLRISSVGAELDETHQFEYKSDQWNAV